MLWLTVVTSFLLGKKIPVTSLQALVSWYQEHSQTCPHEPQLKALEPVLGLSTAVLWQCDAAHSFVQHLSWPAGGGSESEAEEEAEGEVEREPRVEVMSGATTRARRKMRKGNAVDILCLPSLPKIGLCVQS